MKRLFLTLALVLVAPAAAGTAEAQETRIAAVVNDDVISVADLAARMRLVFASSNIQDTPETRQRVARQVVRVLIDEKLQMQEAKRLNIKVPDDEINAAIARIEAQNNLPKGGLDSMLTARGIARSTLVDQVTATLAWGRVIRLNLNRVTPISDEEIDGAIARLRETEDQPRARIAEIFLAVNNPQQDDEVHRFADQLFEQLRQGAHFSALVVEKQAGGKAEDDTRVALLQIMFPLAANAPPAEQQKVTAQAESVRKQARSCGEMAQIGRELAPQTSGDLGKVRVGDLPPELRKTVLGLQVAQPSPPVPLRGGIGVLMVCERENPGNAIPSHDQMADDLARQRFESLAQRYLRDLRRAAFVDMRV